MDKAISYAERIAAAQNPIKEQTLVKEGTEYYTRVIIDAIKRFPYNDITLITVALAKISDLFYSEMTPENQNICHELIDTMTINVHDINENEKEGENYEV